MGVPLDLAPAVAGHGTLAAKYLSEPVNLDVAKDKNRLLPDYRAHVSPDCDVSVELERCHGSMVASLIVVALT